MKTQMTSGVEQRIGGEIETSDLVALEYRAREMRAEFLSQALRRAAAWMIGSGRDKSAPGAARAA